eukprot:1315109-Pyramimonas_sp.AAC.1
MGAAFACERSHGGRRWSSPWGQESNEALRGVPKWARWAYANAGMWAFGGAPDGATKRVRGVP